ncbi:MAG: hypothetical protein KDA78_14480 [Planctomycetaceae bacterium]|nr:hypothetical protein [Planctomycetaceae bacterium]
MNEELKESELANSKTVESNRWIFRLILLALIIATGGGIAWFRHIQQPYREAAELRTLIESLAGRKPDNLNTRQWESAVDWTRALHGNTLVWDFRDGKAIRELRLEVEEKLREPADLDTILWIWDRYSHLCRLGSEYQKWRPIMLDEVNSLAD